MITPSNTFAFDDAFPPADCDREGLRMAWRDACADLQVAYHGWREGGIRGRAEAFAAYVAAADREAAAAAALERGALPSHTRR
jgi:hypothetical protein